MIADLLHAAEALALIAGFLAVGAICLGIGALLVGTSTPADWPLPGDAQAIQDADEACAITTTDLLEEWWALPAHDPRATEDTR